MTPLSYLHLLLENTVGLEESLRLELNCDGYDGIHSTVVCPYYINTGMFAGVSRSLIPVLTPEYVVKEAVKAVLVNQEVLCLPRIVYFIVMLKGMLPTKSFLWFHRAIGAASTMKTFTGRNGPPPTGNGAAGNNNKQQQPLLPLDPKSAKSAEAAAAGNPMSPPAIGITIPDDVPNVKVHLNQ